MSKVASEERVNGSSWKVELREGEVVQVGVHLVGWPEEIHQIEQSIQSNDQVPHVALRKHLNNSGEEIIETPSTSSWAEVSFREIVKELTSFWTSSVDGLREQLCLMQ